MEGIPAWRGAGLWRLTLRKMDRFSFPTMVGIRSGGFNIQDGEAVILRQTCRQVIPRQTRLTQNYASPISTCPQRRNKCGPGRNCMPPQLLLWATAASANAERIPSYSKRTE